MASSIKRGAILTEFALITPLMLVFFLLVLQYGLVVKTNWMVDLAAENACRASMVNDGKAHPDPEVAAQLTLIPVSGTTFLRGTSAMESDNKFLNWGSHYMAAIAKTTVESNNYVTVNRSNYSCTVQHAMELRIPLANHIIGHSTKLFDFGEAYIKNRFDQREELNLAEKWSAISGVPHILLKREVDIRY